MFQIPRFIAHKSNTMCNKQPFSTHSISLLTFSPAHPSTLRTEYPILAQTSAPQPTLRTEYPIRAQTSTPPPTLRTEYPIRAQTSAPHAPTTTRHTPRQQTRPSPAHKKRGCLHGNPFCLLAYFKKLSLNDSTHWASVSASTAISTHVSVNFVNVAC